MIFRPEMSLSIAGCDAPLATMVPDAVPAVALSAIRQYIESINHHAKIDYSPTTKRLVISCASHEHYHMSNIGPYFMDLITSNGNAFTGNDPAYEIVGDGDCGILLGGEKHGYQPDGGLRLINRRPEPPFLIWEVLDSQTLAQMIEMIGHCFSHSNGRIHINIIIQLIRQSPASVPKRKRTPESSPEAQSWCRKMML